MEKCPHCGREYEMLKRHTIKCKLMPPVDVVRHLFESDATFSARKLGIRFGVSIKFSLGYLKGMGMEHYIKGKKEKVSTSTTCKKCGRSFTKITRHRTVCDKLPPRDELIDIFEGDKTISTEALTRQFGVSSQFICDTLRHYGLEKYIGRRGVHRLPFRSSPETETDERCQNCAIKIFSEVPAVWKNEGMEKVGDLCARCARIRNE